ncbi:hypothetical protein [Halobellus rufus]|nr:hypothetical protein [Halobellus rufus]
MKHGHDPREVREYSWRDLEIFLTVTVSEPDIDFESLFGRM